jgi:hypothetical protein
MQKCMTSRGLRTSHKSNGLDPELYLRTVLAQVAAHPINRIADLLPWNLAQHHTDTSKAA